MLDINLFCVEKGGDPNIIRESQRRRLKDVSLVDQIILLRNQWTTRQFELEQAKKDINELDRKIKILKIADLDATEKIMELEDLKKEIPAKKVDVDALKNELNESLSMIGNLVHDSVPIDNNEANNSVVRTWGDCRAKGKMINHVDLVNKLQIANLVKGSKVAGGGRCYLKTEGFILTNALVSFGLALLQKRYYERKRPPTFMRKEIIGRCAQLSQFDEELYKVACDEGDVDEKGNANEKYLVSTSKQPLYAIHMDKRKPIAPQRLPIRYAGSSTCFHTEDRSIEGDTLGLFDVYEYEDVNQFCITSPNDNKSWEMHEEMLRNAEDFYKELGIPHRVVNVVSGALSHAAAKTYKIEGWFPASQTYKELASCSNTTDYMARSLGIVFVYGHKNDKKPKQFVHLLDCTLTSTHTTMCCILENYQTEDGVVVPEALRPFTIKDFLPFKK